MQRQAMYRWKQAIILAKMLRLKRLHSKIPKIIEKFILPSVASRAIGVIMKAKKYSSYRISRICLSSILLMAIAFSISSVNAIDQDMDGNVDRDVLFQVSTIDALMQGVYDGVMKFSDLKPQGDFGIGTFEGIDGEMIALDGEYYQVKADGIAYPVNDTMTTPFSTVTYFDKDLNATVSAKNFTEMCNILDTQIPSKNLFYAIRIDGAFPYVKTRSIPKLSKPYPLLKDAAANQSVFEFNDVNGTIVGFYTPKYAEGLNVPGYHFHLITDDRKAGGHILDLALNSSVVWFDITPIFNMALPSSGDFIGVDLTKDLQEDLKQVEQ
jgi:acetolactate decarboxylase